MNNSISYKRKYGIRYSISNIFKYVIRLIINTCFLSKRPPIFVASIGRSGSTLMYKTISKSLAKERFRFLPSGLGAKLAGGGMWSNYKKLINGVVYKTHLMPKDLQKHKKAKIIFLFSTPSDVVLSVISNKSRLGNKWISKHFKHLKVEGKFNDLSTKDILKIEEQIESWKSIKGLQRIILRYEKIWDYQSEIEDFLNLKLNFPNRKNRKEILLEAKFQREACIKLFENLDKKVSKMNDFEILF